MFKQLHGKLKEKIYNTNGEILQINVPDKKTIIMYCYKDTPTEGIFLGVDNTPDWGLQYPIINIYVATFIFIVGFYILPKKDKENPVNNFYLFYVYIFLVGVGIICYQIYNIINCFEVNNILVLIIGIFITAITFPIIFFRNKMANRYNNAVRKN